MFYKQGYMHSIQRTAIFFYSDFFWEKLHNLHICSFHTIYYMQISGFHVRWDILSQKKRGKTQELRMGVAGNNSQREKRGTRTNRTTKECDFHLTTHVLPRLTVPQGFRHSPQISRPCYMRARIVLYIPTLTTERWFCPP